MQQAERRIQRRKQISPSRHSAVPLRTLQVRLHPFDIPIAKVAPEKLIHALRRFVETVILQSLTHPADSRGASREQPAIDSCQSLRHRVGCLSSDLRGGQFVQRSPALLKLVQ